MIYAATQNTFPGSGSRVDPTSELQRSRSCDPSVVLAPSRCPRIPTDYIENLWNGINLLDHAPQTRCLVLGAGKAHFLPKAVFLDILYLIDLSHTRPLLPFKHKDEFSSLICFNKLFLSAHTQKKKIKRNWNCYVMVLLYLVLIHWSLLF